MAEAFGVAGHVEVTASSAILAKRVGACMWTLKQSGFVREVGIAGSWLRLNK